MAESREQVLDTTTESNSEIDLTSVANPRRIKL